MITIIGAGVSGLSAGIYLQMNGYETEIYEKHYIPGGVCTGWYKNGYYIDGCIHWLMGTKKGTGYSKMWDELGVLEDIPIIQKDVFLTVELSNGEIFEITNDLKQFINQLHVISPEDASFIRDLENSLKALSKANIFFDKPDDIATIFDKVKNAVQLGSSLKVFSKYSKITIGELTKSFNSKYLAEIIQEVMGIDDFAAIALFTTLNNFFIGNSGIPQGGSLALAKRLAQRYQSMGGKLHLNMPVDRIITQNGRATSIVVKGNEIETDLVISAADGYITYTKLLDNEYMSSQIKDFYKHNKPFKPLIIVSYGSNDQLEEIPHVISFPLKKVIDVGGEKIHRIKLRNHNYDPTLNKKKGAVIQVNLFSNWEFWNDLYHDLTLYNEKKDEIAAEVLEAIESHFPTLKGRLTCVDVATPKTFFHFTSVWKGAFEGWLLTPDNVTTKLKKQIEGLENVFHIGQWTTPGGGVTIAVKDGRDIARIICRRNKRKFKT